MPFLAFSRVFRVCFIHQEFGEKESHFISNPVDIKCDSVKCLADDRFYLCGNYQQTPEISTKFVHPLAHKHIINTIDDVSL